MTFGYWTQSAELLKYEFVISIRNGDGVKSPARGKEKWLKTVEGGVFPVVWWCCGVASHHNFSEMWRRRSRGEPWRCLVLNCRRRCEFPADNRRLGKGKRSRIEWFEQHLSFLLQISVVPVPQRPYIFNISNRLSSDLFCLVFMPVAVNQMPQQQQSRSSRMSDRSLIINSFLLLLL